MIPTGVAVRSLIALTCVLAASILEINNTFGAQWRQPSRSLDPRMVQLSGRLEF